MAEIEEFEIPDFLQKNSEDDIHDEMMAIIPDDYDKSEGQHLWNFTRPTALIASELKGYDLPRAISLIWPKFCVGEYDYMNYHAETRSMRRKEAQYALGTITFTGTPDTVIPAGYICSTESKNDIPSRDYITLKECVIGADGKVTVNAQAYSAGADSNTAANTIILNSSGFDDITDITNDVPFIGGINEESDEDLLKRIQEYDKMQGNSNIGNPSDYKRWAESVPGTGHANVIRSTDTSGLVTIILTDGNSNPATTALCEKVYDYIMSPNDESARLAPCGATLEVIPPTTQIIAITANVDLRSGTVESVTAAFAQALDDYYPEAIENGEVLYQKICGILGDLEGVYDYDSVMVNDGQQNINLTTGVFPVTKTSNITLTLVTV